MFYNIMQLLWSIFLNILVFMDKVVFAESDIIVHGIAAKWVSNWEKHLTYQKLANFTYKKDIYVNKLESVIFRM